MTDAGLDTSNAPIEAAPADTGPVLLLPKDPSGLTLEIVDETSVKLTWLNNADNADSFETAGRPTISPPLAQAPRSPRPR